MKTPIYMDYHATTPVDPRVLEAMLPFFTTHFGNAASRTHRFGQRALEAVESARAQVAGIIGAEPREIIFTSGATESNNLAIAGAAEAYSSKGKHIITSAIEHKAVLDVCRSLETRGFSTTIVPVGKSGIVNPRQISDAITSETILVSVMHANNEIGTIQPIAEIGELARAAGVIFHSDAAQSVGKIPVSVREMNVALLSVSAHKLYGPKGVGALYVSRRDPMVRLREQIHGGGHERGLRSGTLNVPAIVGFGIACKIASDEMQQEALRVTALRDRLWQKISQNLEGVHLNGTMEQRLPGNLNVSFERVEGESLIMSLQDIAVSSGSACTSASQEPSHVLRAIGVSNEMSHGSIRFGLGRFTTDDEVDYVAQRIIDSVTRLRQLGLGSCTIK
jgi:cysteine desulfurase